MCAPPVGRKTPTNYRGVSCKSVKFCCVCTSCERSGLRLEGSMGKPAALINFALFTFARRVTPVAQAARTPAIKQQEVSLSLSSIWNIWFNHASNERGSKERRVALAAADGGKSLGRKNCSIRPRLAFPSSIICWALSAAYMLSWNNCQPAQQKQRVTAGVRLIKSFCFFEIN